MQAFIAALNSRTGKNYRLPTEAEWEYAARGGKYNMYFSHKYSGSNTMDDVGWCYNNSHAPPYSHEVGEKAANLLGIYDMSGNVWECCQDWYGESLPRGTNPTGPDNGSERVVRGCSWNEREADCHLTTRYSLGTYSQPHIGFRVVLP
ncbi:MAG: formylglycine-generating enzyme family protein [Prevotellaceae bacterium]|nr:formylglycine-generating enzyme family protein [Prevotellaceae bacterium]